MQVFTDDWLDKIKTRYRNHPAHQRPLLYSIAVSNEYSDMRMQIEIWLGKLSPELRKRFTSNLRSREFFRAYNELAIGSLLMQLGYAVEYEKVIDGVTPDWYVYGIEDSPAFLVEVLTDNISRQQQTRNSHIQDLIERMCEIPIGATIFVNVYPHTRLDEQVNRKIVYKLEKWLDTHPAVNAEMCYDVEKGLEWRSDVSGSNEAICLSGPRFCLVNWDNDYRKVYPYGPAYGIKVDISALRRKFQDKIKKYTNISARHGLPLVIAAIGNPGTGRDFEIFADVLLGQQALDTRSGKAVRRDDGLFGREPYLSAAIWADSDLQRAHFEREIDYQELWSFNLEQLEVPGLEQKHMEGWELSFVPNEAAALPLASINLT